MIDLIIIQMDAIEIEFNNLSIEVSERVVSGRVVSEEDNKEIDNKSLYFSELSSDMKFLIKSYYYFLRNNKVKNPFYYELYFDGNISQDFVEDFQISLSEEIYYNQNYLFRYLVTDNLLMLKPYTGQKKIIFFCGCGQQQSCNGTLFDEQIEDKYRKEHSHDEYFSVDCNLAMVPHAIGYIGNCTFSFIPSNSIEEILFEGGRAKPNDILTNELTRLLTESGKIIDDTAFYKKDKILAVKRDGKLKFNKYYTDLDDYFRK
jgi:hypothetical protein